MADKRNALLDKKWRHLFAMAVLLVIAACIRWPFTTLDFNSLLSSYLADDAFYYFKIASHLATEHRITYDGDQLSNGFHPLWLAVITPFYTPTNDGMDFIYRVQWLMFGIDLLTVVVLFFVLQKLQLSEQIAFVGALLFCIHSTFVDIQMNGLETSLNTLLLLMLLSAFIVVYRSPEKCWRQYVAFGLLAGMTFLARTDNAITVLLLFSALAWCERKQYKKNIPFLLVAAAVMGVIVLPWLAWNWTNFGSIVQGSGKIETIYWGEPHFSIQRTAYSFLMMPVKVYGQLEPFTRLFVAQSGNVAWMVSGFLLFVSSMMLWCWRSRRASAELKALAIFSVGVLAVFCYHAAFRSFVRTWYYIPVGLVFLLLVMSLVSFVQKKWQIPLLLLCVVSVLWQFSPLKLTGKVTEPSTHQTVADWINANTPQTAVIGSMNSGVLSYLVHRKVINLDGVVDARSMRAHWEKKQPEYIHERGINYLVDNDGGLQFFCRDNPLHICVPVFAFGDTKNSNKVVQIVNRQGVLPPAPAMSREKQVTRARKLPDMP